MTQSFANFKQQFGMWICQEDYSEVKGGTIAYIEKNLYDQLVLDNIAAKEKLAKVTAIAQGLADFYGDEQNWNENEIYHDEDNDESLIEPCSGKLARQKQKELDEILKGEV
jgi:hypothetical protein